VNLTMRCTERGRYDFGQILLADDDESYRVVLAAALRLEGFEVIELDDGNALQAHLAAAIVGKDGIAKPAMVISDLNMSGLDGFEVLRWLRAQDVAMPFLLITTDDVSELREKAADLGANGLLDKAFELKELKELIRKLCQESTIQKGV
jgi:DNA-binding response OmpR family regulator